ncbi:MAG: hypothetical protein P4L73_16525 [Caulobacteraceae bacterium]|nr:hypothetical protein [Caulobacteraceae bacterium]
MRRPAVLAAIAAAAAWTGVAWAGVAWGAPDAQTPDGAQPTHFLSWPGKSGAQAAPAPASPAHAAAPAGRLTLSRQFFAGGGDLAAAPAPLDPRPVPGTQAATSTDNTATNRARQNDILTADSAADGPVGGAEAPN